MTIDLTLMKWTAVLCCFAALAVTGWLAIAAPDAPVLQQVHKQIAVLDQRLRRQLLPAQGRIIVVAQLLASLGVCGWALLQRDASWLGLLVVVALAPTVLLARMQKKRMLAIDAQIDGFTLALANSLRATPNVARALETVASSMPSPLRQELELALRELRVGSTVEQALGELGMRVGSTQFDATISALLIGKRVGGDVPAILNDTATSLREIVRLQSVLRAKTADGRVQAMVLSIFPVVIAFGFDLAMPGYFAPLTASFGGVMTLLTAGVCWVAAIALSRRILMVQL